MASSDNQLRVDMDFTTTSRDAGVSVSIPIRLYDRQSQWAIGNTPRNNRAEVLADVERALDLLEAAQAERTAHVAASAPSVQDTAPHGSGG